MYFHENHLNEVGINKTLKNFSVLVALVLFG
jgi:hypothetical protein